MGLLLLVILKIGHRLQKKSPKARASVNIGKSSHVDLGY